MAPTAQNSSPAVGAACGNAARADLWGGTGQPASLPRPDSVSGSEMGALADRHC